MERYSSHTLVEDMELISKIFPVIDNTITTFGKNKLKAYLKTFTVRQTNILVDSVKYLNDNDFYRNKLETELKFINKNNELINKWLSYPRNNQLEFFMGLKYNVNKLISGYDFDIFNNMVTLTLSNAFRFSTVLVQIIFYILMYRMFRYTGNNMTIQEYVWSLVMGYYTSSSFFLSYLIPHTSAVDIIAKIGTVAYVCHMLYSCYKTIMDCIDHYKICEDFKEDYYLVTDVIKSCKKIFDYDEFKHLLWSKNDLDKFKESFVKLRSHFNYDFILGEIVVESINYVKFGDYLRNILDYISNIDVLISNSKLLNMGYTSPNYDMYNAKPFLHGTNLWNPLLKFDNQVRNNVTLGFTENNTMILTGPNKAGKSTYMRTLILATYLSQSLGITCAETLHFTPFDNMFTYLNVPDSIGKESLFEAELERCYDYYNTAKNLSKNKKVIGFIDELFTGTNYLEGMSGSYAIIKKISEYPSALTVVSTHFHEICNIKNVQYCKFYANVKDENTLQPGESIYDFTYKIENGISDQCIALNLLKEKGYGDEIVDIAIKKLNQTKNK